MISINFLIPVITYGLIYKVNDETSPSLALCLGKAYKDYFTTEYLHCSVYENVFARYGCRIWSYILLLLMSNFLDVYFVFQCTKSIKDQTEESKSMISKKDYIIRKR